MGLTAAVEVTLMAEAETEMYPGLLKPKSSKRMKGRGSDESLKVWISDLGEGREERRRRREKRMRRRRRGDGMMRCI